MTRRLLPLLVTSALSSTLLLAGSGIIYPLAGGGTGNVGGPATSMALSNPVAVAVDPAGNTYIADTGRYRIVRVDAVSGIATLFAGNGLSSYSGDGGAALSAGIGFPGPMTFDRAGNLYFSDGSSNRVRRVDAITGIITTFAGNGTPGFSGDNGPAVAASLNNPYGLAFDRAGDLFIVDYYRIRRVDAVSHIITTVAGTGGPGTYVDGLPATVTAMRPYGIAFDAADNLYATDLLSFSIREIDATTQLVSTVAGLGPSSGSLPYAGDGSYALSTSIGYAGVIAFDTAGNLYIESITFNRILKVDPVLHQVTTVAGNGVAASLGDGGLATSASLNTPQGMAIAPNGDIIESEPAANRVRRIAYSSLTPSQIVVSSSLSGQTVTLTSTVAPLSGPGIPTGTVQFFDGTSSIGSAPLNNQIATLSTSTLAPGVHNISAAYSGDASFATSTSSSLAVTVPTANPTPTTVALTSGQNPTTLNVSMAYFVTVSPHLDSAGRSPGGSIDLLDGATIIGSAPVTAGSAQVSAALTTTGSHSLTAVYRGDTYFSASTSPVLIETVKQFTSIAMVSDVNPVLVGSPVTFTATLTQTSATGTISFTDQPSPSASPVTIATIPVSNGTAVFSTNALAPGTHDIVAAYNGDATFVSVGSSYIPLVVNKLGTNVAVSSTQNPTSPNQNISILVTVTPFPLSALVPSGTLQLLDGATVLATTTLTSGSGQFPVSFPATGSHSLTVSYAGDANFAGGTSAVLTQVVKNLATATITADINPVTAGGTVTFTATVPQAGATGTVTFNDYPTPASSPIALSTLALVNGRASFAIATLSAGTHNINAAYNGDANFLSSGSSLLTEVVRTATATAVTAPSNSATAGQPVAFTAQVTPVTATGTVQFMDGATSLGSATLTGGTASLSLSSLSVGVHSITAVYSGDAANAGSTSVAWTETITAVASSVTLTSGANPSIYGQSVTLTANVSPATATGTVQFKDGATLVGTAMLSSGSPSFATSSLSAGSHSITAVYGGDSSNAASTSAALTQTVNKVSSSVTLTSTANPSGAGQSITFAATVTPTTATGTIQFLDGTTSLGTVTVTSGAASFTTSALATGAHTITAVYGGDATNAVSTSAALTQTVNKVSSSVTLTSTANPSVAGHSITFAATVTPTTATGTIQFLDGTTSLGTVTVTSGAASFTTSALATGAHTITATYSGDAADNSATKTLSQTVNAAVPGAPSSLTAVASSTSQINLTWTASPTSGVTYNIYSSTTTGFTPSTANRIATGLTATSYSHTALSASTAYYYIVKAQNAAGESSASNQASTTTLAPAGLSCHVVYSVTTQWTVGFGTAITIQNTGLTPINGWTLSWTWAGNQQITQVWNATSSQTGKNASLTNVNWNPTIAPGATVSGMGFNGSYSGTNATPTAFYVNGTLCH